MSVSVNDPAAAIVLLVLAGISAGLLLQFIAVLTGVDITHSTRAYVTSALFGIAGAFLNIPFTMLLDKARGGPGDLLPHLFVPTAAGTALLAVCYWIIFSHLSRPLRWRFFAGIVVAVGLLVWMVMKSGS
jgi:hypothetical protein